MSAARETLRLTEQTVLLNAATAYMNLIRDAAILDLQRRNVEVLQEQLRQTRDRFNVGEVTRTDVAQSESRLAAARAPMLTAESNYTTSRATYRQVIGVEPGKLAPASPVDRLSPQSLPQAIIEARARHPAVTTAMFNVDAALFQVKIAESSLYPTLNVVGSAQQNYGSTVVADDAAELRRFGRRPAHGAGLSGRHRIRDDPPGQGDAGPAAHRPRHRARPGAADVVQTWGQLEAAKAQIQATTDPGERGRDRAQRRARGGPRRPAHHARRAQRPAGTGQRPRRAGHRPARPRGRVLFAAGGGRAGCRRRCWSSMCRSTTRWCTTIRCATPGSACARRTESNGRRFSVPRVPSTDVCRIHKAALAFDRTAVPYLRRSESDIECSGVIRRAALRIPRASCGGRGIGARDVAMSQPAKAQEPSMEEILASIRRIIADDDTAKPAPPPAPAPRRRPRRRRRAAAAAAASDPAPPPAGSAASPPR